MLQDKNVEDVFAASPLQQGMLYHALTEQDPAAYLEQYSFIVNGPLDLEAYRQAWRDLTDRQPMLRASFHWEGLQKAYLVIHRHVSLPFTVDDDSDLSPAARESRVEDWLRRDRESGFEHNRAPLFRVHVHRLGQMRHRVTLTLHHAIADGWSLTILLTELGALYAGGKAGLKQAPSFRAYLEWLARQDHDGARRWWRERLSTIGAPTPLPLAGPGSKNAAGRQSRSRALLLDEAESAALKSAARAMGVTESTLFSAAWALLLARYNNLDRVVFGETVSTRPAGIDDVERTVGLFLNVLPSIVSIDDHASCRDWLRGVQSAQAAARRHDFLPLVEMQALTGLPAGTGLFPTMVVWENQPGGEEDNTAGGNDVEPVRSYEKNSYALMLAGYPGRKIRLAITYDPGLFGQEDIDCLLHQVRHLLLQLVAAGEAPVSDMTLDAAQRTTAVPAGGGPALALSGGDPWSCFAALVEQAPMAAALVEADGAVLTRHALHARALALALRVQAAKPDERPLAIRLHPGADYAAAILAALRLGRTWFSLDPRRPESAVRDTLARHGPCVVVTERTLWSDDAAGTDPVIDCTSPGPVPPETILPAFRPPAPEDTACVVFTSGSTGEPKGVELPHGALGNRLAWMARDVPAGPDALACLKTSPAFVDAVCELLAPLVFGYPAVVPEAEAARDPMALWSLVSARRVTHLVLTPTVLSALLAQNAGTMDALRILQVSGEAFPPALATEARGRFPHARILNLYGSSEVTADATWCEVLGNESEVPIGRPIAGTEVWIVDGKGRSLPFGAVGELMISGAGLANGYRRDPGQTAGAFHLWTAPDGRRLRLYRTGDMAVLRADGMLLYRGRRDNQLKIRGIRIEPGEIEAHLKRHPDIGEAVATLFSAPDEAPRLVAYVARRPASMSTSPSTDNDGLAAGLRNLLLRHLPRSMVPEAIVVLPALPRTATGKIDRRALPPPSFGTSQARADIVPPHGETERIVQELWTATLGRRIDSVTLDFFAAGGNSISMTQLCFNIRRRCGIAFPIRAALDHPDIRSQARLIEAMRHAAPPDAGTGSGAGARPAVDLDAESRMADAIELPGGNARGWPRSGARIFLSGAEGFINAWLLARLLDEPDVTVRCLAPGADEAQALAHLAAHLAAFGLWTDKRGRALRAVAGDLAAPQFGLPPAQWSMIARETDVLFHTGVHINFLSPYDRLRAPNVLSTRSMIELAATAAAKPLHFVGSLGVVDHANANAASPAVDESTALDAWQGMPNGYLQARWVSDRMMRRALGRGLAGSILRMTTVCGDLSQNRPNPQDMFWRLVELMIQCGAVPDGERPVNFVPVDQAAAAMIALAKDPSASGLVHHLCDRTDLKWRDVGRVLQSLGYAVDCLSGPDWAARVNATVDRASPLWQETLPLIGDAWRDYDHFIPILSDATHARLAAKGLSLHPVDDGLLSRNLQTLIDLGHLSAPTLCNAAAKRHQTQ